MPIRSLAAEALEHDSIQITKNDDGGELFVNVQNTDSAVDRVTKLQAVSISDNGVSGLSVC